MPAVAKYARSHAAIAAPAAQATRIRAGGPQALAPVFFHHGELVPVPVHAVTITALATKPMRGYAGRRGTPPTSTPLLPRPLLTA
jgi:hypothetical protein